MSCKARILHAACNTYNMDFYVNDECLDTNVCYKDLTYYSDVCHGEDTIKVFPTGKKYAPIITAYTILPEKSCHTIIAVGKPSDLGLFVVLDAYYPVITNKAYIRFINLSPDYPDLDFTFTDGAFIMVNDVNYKEITQYYPATPGTYTIEIRITRTEHVILTIPSFTLRCEKFYTIYIIGPREGWTSLDYLFCMDGED